jgi:hypothetical protein
MTRRWWLVALFVPAGCMSMLMPAKKPLPAKVADDPALEQEATRAAINQPGSSGTKISNADIVHARIVGNWSVQQDPSRTSRSSGSCAWPSS